MNRVLGNRVLGNRVLRRIGALMLGATLVWASLPQAASADQTSPYESPVSERTPRAPVGASAATHEPTATPRMTHSASETSAATSRLNDFRRRAGLAPVRMVPTPGALLSHAKYVDANINLVGLNVYTEDPSRPMYTAQGAAIAPETEAMSADRGTFSTMVDLFSSDPSSQHFSILDPTVTQVAFASYGQVKMMWFNSGPQTAVDLPIKFPQGERFPLTSMDRDIAPYYTQGCAATSSEWGFPLTWQWSHGRYQRMDVVSSQILVDGAPVPHCVLNQVSGHPEAGQVVLVPTKPLPAGSHVKATIRVNAFNPDNTSSDTLNSTSEFSTAMGTIKGLGDQTGDGIADVLAVAGNGDLLLYKGSLGGRLRNGWAVGRGWDSFRWMGRVPDVTGDGREDLVGVRSDGHMYLYTGVGMGSFQNGRKVGQNWQGLRNLTVMGDMTGDGTPEVVGISANNDLLRYTLTSRGFTGQQKIGQNWGAIAHMTSVGSLNGDNRPDLVAVTRAGLLYRYDMGGAGNVVKTTQIGRGWTGWTAFYSPGDFNRDGLRDLIGRRGDGKLFLYQNNGTGFVSGREVGSNWNGIRLFG